MVSAVSDATDARLIERARAGEDAAYAELVRRYAGMAHRAAVVMGPSQEAEDVVQEAFVRAYFALDRFRLDAAFQPWLLAIVANTARNRSRAVGRRLRLLVRSAALESVELVPSAETSALIAAERAQLHRAVNELPPKDRLVVACRYLLDMSELETAQVLGWPPGSVKSRLSRALDKLRLGLVEEGETVA